MADLLFPRELEEVRVEKIVKTDNNIISRVDLVHNQHFLPLKLNHMIYFPNGILFPSHAVWTDGHEIVTTFAGWCSIWNPRHTGKLKTILFYFKWPCWHHKTVPKRCFGGKFLHWVSWINGNPILNVSFHLKIDVQNCKKNKESRHTMRVCVVVVEREMDKEKLDIMARRFWTMIGSVG